MLQLKLPTAGRPVCQPDAPPLPRGPGHLAQLDSLRGVACLLVLVAHLKAVPQLGWVPDVVGTAGVGLFFVLSGFLISRILLADRVAGRGLAAFYNRRVARIFPIYYLTLLVLAVAWPGREVGWAATFSFNFRSLAEARNYFAADAAGSPPVAHVWSLCVEEHFYWVWPFAVRLLPIAVLRWLLVGVVLATPAVGYLLADGLRALGFTAGDAEGLLSRVTATQLVALSLGCLFALHEAAALRRGRAIGLALVGVAAGWLLLPAGPVRAATAGTALHLLCGGVFLVCLTVGWLGRGWLLPAVGAVSYGLYLYHLPVYAAFGLTDMTKAADPLVGGAALILTLGVAVASYRLVERPILRRVRSGLPGRWRYAGAMLTAAIAVAFAATVGRAYWNIYRVATTIRTPVAGSATGQPAPPSFPISAYGQTVRTLAIGSSHAQFGFASPEFRDPTYNLGTGAEDLWYSCKIMQTYLGRLPALRRVVIAVDAHAIHATLAATKGLQWHQAVYFHANGVRARVDDERLYGEVALAASDKAQDLIASLKRRRELPDDHLRGWGPTPQKAPLDPSYGKWKAKEFEGMPAAVEENLAVLIETIRECERHGIACVLVATPKHATLRDNFSPAFRAETAAAIRRVTQATGVPYLDYEADPRFEAADFFDCDHLSQVGAVKFTRLLDADLNRVAPLPKE
jgi:peptidoglycan/LPS O-acetylase OafA/YrhL